MSSAENLPSPINLMFVITSMPVGGAETLLVNMIRQMDRSRCQPFVCCLKDKDVLGEAIADEVTVFSDLINHKFDVTVLGRLKRILVENDIHAVITVGAGDKMFWGRLAAKRARVPVILSALHSTGWPDGVGRMNRMLTPITDGFIAVAENHGKFLVDFEKFPQSKVFVIPNGIDSDRFQRDENARAEWRKRMDIADNDPTVGIVAALRPEKNHQLFLQVAQQVKSKLSQAKFVVAGDGELQADLEALADELGIANSVRFLGSVDDIPGVLSSLDLFALTSDNEASPVSILEAMSCELPVVATDVGSVSQSVIEGKTGFLVPTQNVDAATTSWLSVLEDLKEARILGQNGREHVLQYSSLQSMTDSYLDLISGLYSRRVFKRADSAEIRQLSIGSYVDV